MSIEATESFPRQQAATRRFRLGAPRAFHIAPDGSQVTFLRSRSGRDPLTLLWAINREGVERVIVDPAVLLAGADEDLPPQERARRERMREVTGGVTAYAVDSSGTVAAFAISGVPYAVQLNDPTAVAVELPAPGPAIDPRPDPTGRRVAFVSGGALQVCVLDSRTTTALCEPESPSVTYGLADFAAAEELERVRGFWWLPDGQHLLVERVDDAPVQTLYIGDPANPDREPQQHRYPAAGTANADVSLWLVDVDGGRQEVPWDHVAYPYLMSVVAGANGDPLVSVLSRDQRTRVTYAVDPANGSLREVVTRTDDCWVDVIPGVPCWSPEGRLIDVVVDRQSDAYRVVVDDVMLTPADLQVESVADVDESGLVVSAWCRGTSHLPLHVAWDGTITALASEQSTVASATRDGDVVVVTEAARADGRQHTSLHINGARAGVIESYAEEPRVDVTAHDLSLGSRALRSVVLFPRDHVPGSQRLPIICSPYGGPHHSRVMAWDRLYAEDQWIADQGFCVLISDGRGTPGRGPAWDRAVHRDLATPVLQDQVDAVTALCAAYPADVDGSRVGIRGWSFGGYLSALAVLARPDVFHAAVAGAPVTEWRLYDTAYTERYLGNPAEDAEPYDACSLLTMAAGLTRPLMIVHGLADDNVVAAHTLQLSSALLAAGRPHTVLPLSGVTHMTPQEVVAENLLRLEVEFLRDALGS